MATTDSSKRAKRTRVSTGVSAPQRRTVRKARAAEHRVPAKKVIPAGAAPKTLKARRVSRGTLKPLKEVYFVGVGFVDWAVEQLCSAEKTLALRGQKRNETLGQMASGVSASVSSGATSIYRGARRQIGTIGERVGDKVSEGVRKFPLRRRAGEVVPMAQPV